MGGSPPCDVAWSVRGAFPFGLKPQKFVHTQSLPGGAARRSADTGRGCHSCVMRRAGLANCVAHCVCTHHSTRARDIPRRALAHARGTSLDIDTSSEFGSVETVERGDQGRVKGVLLKPREHVIVCPQVRLEACAPSRAQLSPVMGGIGRPCMRENPRRWRQARPRPHPIHIRRDVIAANEDISAPLLAAWLTGGS